MSKLVYLAAIGQLRGEAQEALASLEYLLAAGSIPNNGSRVQEVKQLARQLVESEGAMLTLQQYFGQQFSPELESAGAAEEPPPRTPTSTDPPRPVTLAQSPTMRESLKTQKLAETASTQEEE